MNRWGDTRMGIGFPDVVDVEGAWVAGQSSAGAWADGLRAIGFRDGEEVARTDWFEKLEATPTWFEMQLMGVDRIEIVARPVIDGAGWYALDDLTFVRTGSTDEATVVVDFDDLPWRTTLTGSNYAGLEWELGSGTFREVPRSIHAPIAPPGDDEGGSAPESGPDPNVGPGTLPELGNAFFGMRQFEDGTSFIPADTCGAIGPEHFASVVNVKLGVFDKATGTRLFDAPLTDFFGTSGLGDPRITYDHYAGRWFLLASSGPGTARIYFALSLTSDPTGAWFKSYIETAQGSDVGRWPDYPTLGFDAHGYYIATLMVPSPMTIWAIDKAPLLASPPALGPVSVWRDLQFEGAIQPCVTYGDSGGGLLVSRRAPTRMHIRRISGPLTAPTLSTVALVDVPFNENAPNAPALGSTVDLATGDTRPMNAVYRDGSIYTAHAIQVDGRSACRWYELDVASGTAAQVGTVSDPVRSYSYPSISVNADHHVVLGFSGSHAGEYAGCFYTGRHALDPPGVTAPPSVLRAGGGAYNHVDGNGVARWGDYSLTSIDPEDDTTFWTIQKYARINNLWGTWIAELSFPNPCPATWSTCGSLPNSTGFESTLSETGGTSLAANSMTLVASNVIPNKNGIFFYGPTETGVFLGNGVLCVAGGINRLPVVTADTNGVASFTMNFTNPPQTGGQITPGSTWYFQYWYRDPASGGAGFNLSQAMGAIFCP